MGRERKNEGESWLQDSGQPSEWVVHIERKECKAKLSTLRGPYDRDLSQRHRLTHLGQAHENKHAYRHHLRHV